MSYITLGLKVSVCIVTYNQAEYIKGCVDSVLSQDLDDMVEIIVADDASTDGTLDILTMLAVEHPGKIKVFSHSKNLGPFKNLIFAHMQARGEYIAHLDGDDFWEPSKLSKQLTFIQEHPEVSAVYTNAFLADASGAVRGEFVSGVKSVFDTNYLIKDGNFLPNSSLLYRAKFRNDILNFDGDFVDYAIHIRLSRFGPLGFVDLPLVTYRQDTELSMVRRSRNKVMSLIWNALQEIEDDGNNSAVLVSAKRRFLLDVIKAMLYQRNFLGALKWIDVVGNALGQSAFRIGFVVLFSIAGSIVSRKLKRAVPCKTTFVLFHK